MPRTARADIGGLCYHVLNRGNNRATVFHSDDDYQQFLTLIGQAHEKHPMRVLGFPPMPNHFHLCLWPRQDGALGKFMQVLTTKHAFRYRKTYGGSGHIWSGRFKAFPCQSSQHLLRVLRYIERNPVRAKLAPHVESWPWSSARLWNPSGLLPPIPWLNTGPVKRPLDWAAFGRVAESDEELEVLRTSANRGAPFGDPQWVKQTATDFGIESTLREIE